MATLKVLEIDDGSQLIELAGNGWRLGINLESDGVGSGWYLVTRNIVDDIMAEGELPPEFWQAMKDFIEKHGPEIGEAG